VTPKLAAFTWAKVSHDNYASKKIWVEGTYVQNGSRLVRIEGPHWSTTNEAPGSPERVEEEMRRLKFTSYKIQREGNFDTKMIDDACKNLGVAVGFRNFPAANDYHMVVVTDLTKDKCVFIDNRDNLRYEATRAWFNTNWTGYAIALYPPKALVVEDAPAVKEEVRDDDQNNGTLRK
jgi:hypothetical protein